MQNSVIQNQNMGMNPIMNNNAFFNNGLGNVINSSNKIINICFKTNKGVPINIVSNYETPMNEVIEKFYNRLSIPIEKRKSFRFLIDGCIIRENDHTSIGNYCNNDNYNLIILANDIEKIIGGKE